MSYETATHGERSFATYDWNGRPASTYTDSVHAFWRNIIRVNAGEFIDTEWFSGQVGLVVSGWVAEIGMGEDNRRQVFLFHLAGDLIDPSAGASDRRFVAVTNVEICDAASLRTRRDMRWHAKISEAEARREEQLFNHLTRIGRLTAEERLLHLLLEIHDRLEKVGLAKSGSYRLPVTQQMLADALGLSLVHINRTLQELRRRNLITLRRGVVTLYDRAKLAAMACYEACGELDFGVVRSVPATALRLATASRMGAAEGVAR